MIKCKLSRDNGNSKITAKGTAHNLAIETATLISNIYLELLAKNPHAADEYKRKIIAFTIAPDSPVWTGGAEE